MRHTYGVVIGKRSGEVRTSVDKVRGKERDEGRERERERERDRRGGGGGREREIEGETEAPGYSRQVMTHCFLQKALTMLSIIAK